MPRRSRAARWGLAGLIEAVGLTKRYGTDAAATAAVDGLYLSVPEGELFGFLGENGAGKTTTIKMLTGLIPPSSGVARIGGWDVGRDPLEAKRLVGYIPDNPFLYERLTGREFLRFMGDLYGVPPDAARERDLLRLFELDAKAETPIGDYSRGMRQKVALAAALLHDPRALFLDEPTVGLDPRSTRLLADVLRAVAARGTAVFLSTHVLSIASGLCDRVGILHKGRLVALGTPAALTDDGRRSLEEAFLSLTGGVGAEGEVARLLGPETGGRAGDAPAAARP